MRSRQRCEPDGWHRFAAIRMASGSASCSGVLTGEDHWLVKARHIAHQCTSWCVSYNFEFPASSPFGRLGFHTAGAVYPNVQNKHAAPGICVLSGDSLLRLFRATGERFYLELL